MSLDSRGRRPLRWLALAVLLAPLASFGEPGEPPAARESVGLLEAMERGSLAVVGRIGQIERLDIHGYRASIWVERILGARANEHEEGTPIRFAWEELATGRPPRFSESERALVCLERLSNASIWRQRIPDPTRRRQTAGLANDGDAFLRGPSLGTLDRLHHYLSLDPEDRDTASGAAYLVALAEMARRPLAIDAARRLARFSDLDEKLDRAGEQALVRALLREDSEPMLAAALLSVFEAAATPSLARALLQARKNLRDAPAPQIFEAAARMPDGLREADLTWLLARNEARYRVIVARTVSGSNAAATLRRLLASDPAPEVRAAAISRLIALADSEALVLGLTALADVDPLVRSAAARGAASFGAQAVTGLRSVAYGTFEPCAGSEEARARRSPA